MKYQGRRQLYAITEYRDGCVYRTKFVKEVWVDVFSDEIIPAPNTQLVSLPSKRQLELGHKGTMRLVEDSTPSIVDC
jgi:hypothetical protein